MTYNVSTKPYSADLFRKSNYKRLAEQIVPGKVLAIEFAAGTTGDEIHKMRAAVKLTASRLPGMGKLTSKTEGTTLYIWIKDQA